MRVMASICLTITAELAGTAFTVGVVRSVLWPGQTLASGWERFSLCDADPKFQAKKSHSSEWLFSGSWSGKRDSYLVSDSLKSKGFLLLTKQEKT
ncbi:hypothetical protein [Pseudomonas citrulli]|uniref:Secreted protein n=1 Tax=Pseudomonas citrulli TaxID=3064347 RepID=A0ABT9BUP3_9PSED|nr:hypothetical protein [Pseudomonas sp. K18]MDO7896236.1 hypothetical protein [Pseudomonas sp. K18]